MKPAMTAMLNHLRAQKDAIDRSIAALEGLQALESSQRGGRGAGKGGKRKRKLLEYADEPKAPTPEKRRYRRAKRVLGSFGRDVLQALYTAGKPIRISEIVAILQTAPPYNARKAENMRVRIHQMINTRPEIRRTALGIALTPRGLAQVRAATAAASS